MGMDSKAKSDPVG